MIARMRWGRILEDAVLLALIMLLLGVVVWVVQQAVVVYGLS